MLIIRPKITIDENSTTITKMRSLWSCGRMSPYPVVVIVVNAQYMLLMYCVAASVRIRCAPSASPRSSYSRAYAESHEPSGSSAKVWSMNQKQAIRCEMKVI